MSTRRQFIVGAALGAGAAVLTPWLQLVDARSSTSKAVGGAPAGAQEGTVLLRSFKNVYLVEADAATQLGIPAAVDTAQVVAWHPIHLPAGVASVPASNGQQTSPNPNEGTRLYFVGGWTLDIRNDALTVVNWF